MNPYLDLKDELLPAEFSGSGENVAHHGQQSLAPSERQRERPPSYSDGYVLVNGDPARVFRPLTHGSRFTCHALSIDNSRFATGESSGILRMWNSVGCPTPIGSFKESVSRTMHLGLSSEDSDVVYSADDSLTANCIHFSGYNDEHAELRSARELDRWVPTEANVFSKLEESRGESNWMQSRFSFRQQRALQLSEDGDTAAFSAMAWDEKMEGNAYLVWRKVHRFSSVTEEWECLLDSWGFVTQEGTSHLTVGERQALSKKLSLSKNGHGLIDTSYDCRNAIVVYPSLRADNTRQISCTIDNACATWGRNGQYLLLWKPFNDHQSIALYETERLGSDYKDWSAFAERQLGPGFEELEVRMLADSNDTYHLEVLVAEIHTTAETRIYVWDATENTLTIEVHLPVGPQLNIENDKVTSAETDITISGSEHLYVTSGLAYNIPHCETCRFCLSKDRKWIGALCRNLGTCSLLSTVSGAVVCQIENSASELAEESWIFSDVAFDASTRNLLLFSEEVILAVAPAALNTDAMLIPRMLSWKDMLVEQGIESDSTQPSPFERLQTSIRLFSELSPAAFDFTVTNSLDASSFASYIGLTRSSLVGHAMSQKIVGAGHSAEWDYIGCVVSYISLSDIRVRIWQSTSDDVLLPHDFADQMFPLRSDPGEAAAGFIPEKLAFYLTDSGEDRMVLFPEDYRPAVIFCLVVEETWEVVKLQMERCLAFRHTENRRQLCLLDVSGVCFLDLELEMVVSRVDYQVNFCEVLAMVAESQWGERNWKQYLKSGENRMLATDGQSVLLAWDTANTRSITVTPSTQQQECGKRVAEAGDGLNFNCGMVGSGRGGYFWTEPTGSDDQPKHFWLFSAKGDDFCRFEFPVYSEQQPYLDFSVDGSVATMLLLTESGDRQDAALCQFSLYCTRENAAREKLLRLTESNDPLAIAPETVEEFGISAATTSHTVEMTFAHKAILQDANKAVELIKQKCREQKAKMWLNWLSKDGQCKNLLVEAIGANSTKSVEHVMELMKDESTPFNPTAKCMKQCWKDLCHPDFRKSLGKALAENSFVFDACEIVVHVGFLDSLLRRHKAIHIDMAESFLEWKICQNADSLNAKWRNSDRDLAEKLEKDGDKSKTQALMRVVSIEDAAKTGMRGILRPLLLHRVPVQFFKHNAVKWVIQYKWYKIWKQRFLNSSIKYGVFLVCFTNYAIIVGYTKDLSHERWGAKIMSTALVAVNFFWGSVFLNEEIRQAKSLAADGKQYFADVWVGVRYYFMYTWNWLDLISSTFLIVFIPVFHVIEVSGLGCGEILSTFVAFEAILAYIKVWYFAQALRKTGAQVLMIQNIIEDSFYFLLLAFFVLCGFALGLRTVLRHPASKKEHDPPILHFTNATDAPYNVSLSDDSTIIKDSFGTPWSSLETLFYALLGAFEPEIYHSSGGRSWIVSALFILYLICLSIILLNLLISTMGDTFDRVKSTEEAQLLMGKARFMDACEASLTDSERDDIDNKVKKYVRVVVDPDNRDDEQPPNEWMGKLSAIDRGLRSHIQDSEQTIARKLQEQESHMQQTMRSELQTMRKELEVRESRMSQTVRSELQAQQGRLVEHTRALEQRLAEHGLQLESRIADMNEETINRMERLLEHHLGEPRQTPDSHDSLRPDDAD